MRLTTWNVNGIRNPFSYPPWNTARTFPAMFDMLETDIVIMQELKIQRKDLRDDMVLLDGWDCYFSLPKHKKGYSGVGIYTRNSACAPIRAEEGLLGVLPSPSGIAFCELPEEQSIGGYPNALQVAELGVDTAVLDAEGRCLVLEFPAFVLFGVYSPANSNGLRDNFRYGFLCALDCRIRNLIKAGKRVVLAGDLNVSRSEIDTASTLEEMKKNGITHEEYISTPNRRVFNQLLIDGETVGERDEGRKNGVLWDTTRAFHPARRGMYTHWEQKINARPGNFGSRIDFVLVSETMQSWIKNANIQEGLLGSDHCPVFADFRETVKTAHGDAHLLDLMSPPGTFINGDRKRDWRLQDVPAFSGKRLQEFDRRRSIKSMFAAPGLKKSQPSSVPQSFDGRTAESVSSQEAQPPSKPPTLMSSTDQAGQDRKRKTPAAPEKAAMIKKQKGDSATALAGKGQQSLKGFFQPRTASEPNVQDNPTTAASTSHATPSDLIPRLDGSPATSISAATTRATPPPPSTPIAQPTSPTSPTSAIIASPPLDLAARTRTSDSWSALFSRPVAPLCESHHEPCKSMQTKKKGSNQGRSFWMCARPLGPSGAKETGTEWRCGTFIWGSDWSARAEKG